MNTEAYVRKSIKDVDPLKESKLCLLGLVLDKKEDMILLDDGTGKLELSVEPEQVEKIKTDQLVRVFVSILPSPEGFEFKVDCVQDMQGLDLDLYKRVEDLLRRCLR